MKSIIALYGVALALLAAQPAVAATAWTKDSAASQPGTVDVWTSSTSNLVTETQVLDDLDLCSQIVVAIDSANTVTPSVVVAATAGGISITEINAPTITAAGSQTALSNGVAALKAHANNTTSPTTINYTVKAYRHVLCRTRQNM